MPFNFLEGHRGTSFKSKLNIGVRVKQGEWNVETLFPN